MGTTEPVNEKDSIEKKILKIHWSGWRNEPEIYSSILRSETSRASPTTEIEIERVNIRPRKLSFFIAKAIG